MNIALVLQHKLMLGLQRLMGDARNTPTPYLARHQPMAVMHKRPIVAHASHFAESHRIRVNASQTPRPVPPPSPTMPLRVLRVVDKDQPRSCSGRMVISGRMADVCAELDRLVAREAALH